jgi:hypothetical protein
VPIDVGKAGSQGRDVDLVTDSPEPLEERAQAGSEVGGRKLAEGEATSGDPGQHGRGLLARELVAGELDALADELIALLDDRRSNGGEVLDGELLERTVWRQRQRERPRCECAQGSRG